MFLFLDMSATALSRAMAREPWSREYFEILREYKKNENFVWKTSFLNANYFVNHSEPIRLTTNKWVRSLALSPLPEKSILSTLIPCVITAMVNKTKTKHYFNSSSTERFDKLLLLGHKREWKLLHRYGFHTMTLEDGTQLNIGIVSQPCTSSV